MVSSSNSSKRGRSNILNIFTKAVELLVKGKHLLRYELGARRYELSYYKYWALFLAPRSYLLAPIALKTPQNTVSLIKKETKFYQWKVPDNKSLAA
jgi:hypothetical protein